MHVPFVQVGVAPAQTMPHPPQLASSFRVSVQAPPHTALFGAAQHWPDTQLSPPPHALSPAPQWEPLVCVFPHWVPHAVLGTSPHVPATHVPPAAQALPHLPQLASSVRVSA